MENLKKGEYLRPSAYNFEQSAIKDSRYQRVSNSYIRNCAFAINEGRFKIKKSKKDGTERPSFLRSVDSSSAFTPAEPLLNQQPAD